MTAACAPIPINPYFTLFSAHLHSFLPAEASSSSHSTADFLFGFTGKRHGKKTKTGVSERKRGKKAKKKRETVMLCIVNHSLWLFKSVSSPVLPKTVTQQITSFCSGQKNYYVVIAGVDAVVCAPKELILCNPFGFITYSIWGLTTLRPHSDCLCQRFSISEACLLWWAPKSHGEACTKLHACGEIICCLKSN